MFLRFSLSILLGLAGSFCASAKEIPPASRHVVLIVWDGMRPDFVNEKDAPTLWKLGKEGVVFRNHHPVYLSATNVNGTALVTGAYPAHSGIIANQEYRPEINNKRIIAVEDPGVILKGDELSQNKYVAVPTLPELVRESGRKSIVATAKTVGFLQDRHRSPDNKDTLLAFGQMFSSDIFPSIIKALGPFPGGYAPRDAWTTKALIDFLWKDGVPAFSLLWLSEPDGTQHLTAPGMKDALAGIKSSDDKLAEVLSALDRQGVRSTTDIFVVSDHGFSTIDRPIDLRIVLKEAGFNVTTEFTSDPKAGDIMLAGNGGTALFYVVQHAADVTQRLVEFLQQSNFAGVILTRDKIQGTFGLSEAKIDSEHAPDVAMAFRWNGKKNEFGIPGMIDADWSHKAGEGTHATLSRFDMHNTLVAGGPSIRSGYGSDLPSGNVDLAPTILEILGIARPKTMDGRALNEALRTSDAKPPKPETKTLEATKRFPTGIWRQTLQVARVGSTIYLDEGNGAFTPR
jgi:predicted AlkP superfamily pyrophosphatase or phosphodiesterase